MTEKKGLENTKECALVHIASFNVNFLVSFKEAELMLMFKIHDDFEREFH